MISTAIGVMPEDQKNKASPEIYVTEIGTSFHMPPQYEREAVINRNFFDLIKDSDNMPFDGLKINWYDMIWDFNTEMMRNTANRPAYDNRVDFTRVPESFKDLERAYVLTEILKSNIKITSIRAVHKQNTAFMIWLNANGIYSFDEIDTDVIEKYMKYREVNHGSNDSATINPLYRYKCKIAVKKIYSFWRTYSGSEGDPGVISLLWAENRTESKAVQAYSQTSARPDIDDAYFDRFISTCVYIMRDETESKDIRGAAAEYVLLSQTGLRISECLALHVDDLSQTTIADMSVSFINYTSWKTAYGDTGCIHNKTFCNKAAEEAFNTLKFLYQEERKERNTTYLLCPAEFGFKKTLPVSRDKWNLLVRYHLVYAIDKYFKIINIPEDMYHGVHQVKGVKNTGEAQTITLPTNHQFRTHVCSVLYHNNVPLSFIRNYMGHLTNEMEIHYIPDKKPKQEDPAYTNKLFKDIIVGDVKLMGPQGERIMAAIRKFINENKLNTASSIDEICEELSDEIPVRKKPGGVCVKAGAFRDCRFDAPIDEWYCAYDECPNICWVYYMADWSYAQAKQIAVSVEANKSRGLLKYAEKQINVLHKFVAKRLEPEVDETKRMIDKHGKETIIAEHPELEFIINNLDQVEQEIKTWKKMKL